MSEQFTILHADEKEIILERRAKVNTRREKDSALPTTFERKNLPAACTKNTGTTAVSVLKAGRR